MDDQLTKASFLADFFCSELAAEVYRREGDLDEVTKFGEGLWDVVQASEEDQEDDEDYGS